MLKHGGKRQGAGRPKLPQTRKRVIFTLSPETIAKLKDEKNKSGLVEKLLIEYFERNNENVARND